MPVVMFVSLLQSRRMRKPRFIKSSTFVMFLIRLQGTFYLTLSLFMCLELCEELVKLVKDQAVRSVILSKYTFQRSYALDVNTCNP